MLGLMGWTHARGVEFQRRIYAEMGGGEAPAGYVISTSGTGWPFPLQVGDVLTDTNGLSDVVTSVIDPHYHVIGRLSYDAAHQVAWNMNYPRDVTVGRPLRPRPSANFSGPCSAADSVVTRATEVTAGTSSTVAVAGPAAYSSDILEMGSAEWSDAAVVYLRPTEDSDLYSPDYHVTQGVKTLINDSVFTVTVRATEFEAPSANFSLSPGQSATLVLDPETDTWSAHADPFTDPVVHGLWTAQAAAGGYTGTFAASCVHGGAVLLCGTPAAEIQRIPRSGAAAEALTTPGSYSGALFDIASDNTVINAAAIGRFLRSDDAGDTWTDVDAGPYSGLIYTVTAHTSGHFFAGTATGPILETTDGGLTWDTLTTIPGVPALTASSSDGSLAVIAGTAATIVTTTDDGVAWDEQTAPGGYTGDYRGSCFHAGRVYLCGSEGAVHSSADGVTWTAHAVAGGYTGVFYGIGADGTDLVVVGTGGEVQRSSDAGSSWRREATDGPISTVLLAASTVDSVTTIAGEGGEIQTAGTEANVIATLLGDRLRWRVRADRYELDAGPDVDAMVNLANPGSADLAASASWPHATTFAGHRVLDLDGAQHMSGYSGVAENILDAGDYPTVWAVVQFDSFGSVQGVFEMSQAGVAVNEGVSVNHLITGSVARSSFRTAAGLLEPGVSYTDTAGLHVVCGRLTSAAATASLDGSDGTPVATANAGLQYDLPHIDLGQYASGAFRVNGRIAEVIIARDVTDGERATVSAALSAYYGLS